MKILGISGTITGSKTLIVVDAILEEIRNLYPEADIDLLDLKKYDVQFCDGRPISEYTGDTRKVIDLMTQADAYVIGTPIFQGSFSGALKNLIDLVPPSEFKGKVMGLCATGGNYRHYLVLENQLKPIAGYLNAFVAPNVVFAHSEHFNAHNEITDLDLQNEIKLLAEQVIQMNKKLIPIR